LINRVFCSLNILLVVVIVPHTEYFF